MMKRNGADGPAKSAASATMFTASARALANGLRLEMTNSAAITATMAHDQKRIRVHPGHPPAAEQFTLSYRASAVRLTV